MTGWTWLALGAALVLVPLGDPVSERLRSLRLRGRLASPGSHVHRGRALRVRPTTATAPGFGALALLVVTVRAGPVLGVTTGLVVAVGTHLIVGALHRRAAERSTAELLAALRLVVAEVTAGASAEAVLRVAAEMDTSRASTYRAAAGALREGGDAGAVLAADRTLRGFGSAWTVAAVTGAPVAAVLERVAADVSARREHDAAVSAALAGPRSSAAVLAALPVLGILLGLGMDADPVGFLLGTPTGQLMCLVGVGLDVAGLLWTRRLAGAALR
jgi:tight adherence protein B